MTGVRATWSWKGAELVFTNYMFFRYFLSLLRTVSFSQFSPGPSFWISVSFLCLFIPFPCQTLTISMVGTLSHFHSRQNIFPLVQKTFHIVALSCGKFHGKKNLSKCLIQDLTHCCAVKPNYPLLFLKPPSLTFAFLLTVEHQTLSAQLLLTLGLFQMACIGGMGDGWLGILLSSPRLLLSPAFLSAHPLPSFEMLWQNYSG